PGSSEVQREAGGMVMGEALFLLPLPSRTRVNPSSAHINECSKSETSDFDCGERRGEGEQPYPIGRFPLTRPRKERAVDLSPMGRGEERVSRADGTRPVAPSRRASAAAPRSGSDRTRRGTAYGIGT